MVNLAQLDQTKKGYQDLLISATLSLVDFYTTYCNTSLWSRNG